MNAQLRNMVNSVDFNNNLLLEKYFLDSCEFEWQKQVIKRIFENNGVNSFVIKTPRNRGKTLFFNTLQHICLQNQYNLQNRKVGYKWTPLSQKLLLQYQLTPLSPQFPQ